MSQPNETSAPKPKRSSNLPLTALGIVAALVVVLGVLRVQRGSGVTLPKPVSSVVAALEDGGQTARARIVRSACQTEECACHGAAVGALLDSDQHEQVLVMLRDIGGSCTQELRGENAEALARNEKCEPARKLSRSVLETVPTDPHASYAMAHCSFEEGELARAKTEVEHAIRSSRGVPAQVLGARIAIGRNELKQAEDYLKQALDSDPSFVPAVLELAQLSARLDRYRDAREGYLRVLRLQPKHTEALYGLTLLTARAGALNEARFHANKLRELLPKGDAKVAELIGQLDRVPERPVIDPAQVASARPANPNANPPPDVASRPK